MSLLAGCGEVPDPPWVLGDDPLVLALRAEVTELGPHTAGLLPIPADRVRAQPMPGDTVRIRPLVADKNGAIDLVDLQPQWLLCPYGVEGCISTLNDPGGGEPCTGWPEERVACSLGPATELEFTLPELDPERTLIDHLGLQLAFIAADPDVRTTDACIEILSRDELDPLTGCMLAYGFLQVGPIAPLYRLAEEEGIALGVELEDPIVDAGGSLQPNFSPEVEPLVLVGGGEQIIARPGSVTHLKRNVLFGWEPVVNARDAQRFLRLTDVGASSALEDVSTAVFFTEVGLRETFRETFETIPGIDTFSLFVVVADRRGGQGWAQFDFVVGEPNP